MKSLSLLFCLLIIFFHSNSQKPFSTCRSEIIKRAIKALGGQQRTGSIYNLKFSGYGYRNALEQSERFERPYIPSHFDFSTILDLKNTLESYSLNEQIFTFSSNSRYLVDWTTIAMQSQGQITPCTQDQTIQESRRTYDDGLFPGT